MSVSGVCDGSVSVSVPAPPPPSPRREFYSQSNAPVTTFDLDELFRLLRCNVDSASAAAASPQSTSPPAFTTPTHTASDHLVLHLIGSELLTLEGNGGDGLGRAEAALSSSDPSPTPGHRPGSNTDAGDESLQRYKLSLGLGGGADLSDPNDPRVAIIKSLTMETPGRDPVTIDLSVAGTENTLKDHPFTIKEGARFTMGATFKVQHEVLSGLRYVQIVKRKGIKVSKDSEMIGSYAPNTDKQPLYTKRFQEDEAPTGMLARGHYSAFSSFVDDDKKSHLEFEWSFDITKDW